MIGQRPRCGPHDVGVEQSSLRQHLPESILLAMQIWQQRCCRTHDITFTYRYYCEVLKYLMPAPVLRCYSWYADTSMKKHWTMKKTKMNRCTGQRRANTKQVRTCRTRRRGCTVSARQCYEVHPVARDLHRDSELDISALKGTANWHFVLSATTSETKVWTRRQSHPKSK